MFKFEKKAFSDIESAQYKLRGVTALLIATMLWLAIATGVVMFVQFIANGGLALQWNNLLEGNIGDLWTLGRVPAYFHKTLLTIYCVLLGATLVLTYVAHIKESKENRVSFITILVVIAVLFLLVALPYIGIIPLPVWVLMLFYPNISRVEIVEYVANTDNAEVFRETVLSGDSVVAIGAIGAFAIIIFALLIATQVKIGKSTMRGLLERWWFTLATTFVAVPVALLLFKNLLPLVTVALLILLFGYGLTRSKDPDSDKSDGSAEAGTHSNSGSSNSSFTSYTDTSTPYSSYKQIDDKRTDSGNYKKISENGIYHFKTDEGTTVYVLDHTTKVSSGRDSWGNDCMLWETNYMDGVICRQSDYYSGNAIIEHGDFDSIVSKYKRK